MWLLALAGLVACKPAPRTARPPDAPAPVATTGAWAPMSAPTASASARKPDGQPADTTTRDTDGDGVPDAVDACPEQPGPVSPGSARNGCPTLVRIGPGGQLIHETILFDGTSAALTPKAIAQLTELAQRTRDRPEIALRIAGHTDRQASRKVSEQLSQRRAEAVAAWLSDPTKGNIAAERLHTEWHGDEMPIDSNDHEPGRQRNRRVEVSVLAPGAP